jgi:hypothetical protein
MTSSSASGALTGVAVCPVRSFAGWPVWRSTIPRGILPDRSHRRRWSDQPSRQHTSLPDNTPAFLTTQQSGAQCAATDGLSRMA